MNKIQIYSQDMVRRLMNTKEELGAEKRGAVVDRYARKLLQSGYSMDQTRKIVKNGIEGFESKGGAGSQGSASQENRK